MPRMVAAGSLGGLAEQWLLLLGRQPLMSVGALGTWSPLPALLLYPRPPYTVAFLRSAVVVETA